MGALCFVGIVAALYQDELGTDGRCVYLSGGRDRLGLREIVGKRVLDVGLCSDKCKLYEVVGPYGK